MQIRLYATLRAAANSKVIQLTATPQSTIHEMLNAVAAQNPRLGTELFDGHGQLRDIIKVFLNGRQAEYLPDGLATRVSDTDALDIFPPVGGGA